MFKIIYLIFGLVISTLLVGCGSGGSSSESAVERISKRQHVIISYHYPEEVCNSSILTEQLQSIGFIDIITLVTSENVDCRSYGKSNDGRECLIQDLKHYDKPTCVAGMNRSTGKSYKSDMISDMLLMEKIKDTIISVF